MGGPSSAQVDEPAFSMVKVPSDPAQVSVNHASFRVQLGATSARALGRTARVPLVPSSVRPARRTPVVWSGRSAPGDQAATQLLRAVMRNEDEDTAGTGLRIGAATTVLPRVTEQTQPVPTVVEPRRPMPPDDLLRGVRPAYPGGGRGEADEGGYGEYDEYEDELDITPERAARRAEPVRHAWYPGRRMNLGIVLLPLRIFLGFVTIFAGMSKLCDPVYFDGGRRGSMVTWLGALHPWTVAEPLRDFAVAHPVGAGLSVAFAQVIAGVLTVLGLWQRVAAAIGALLSVALLVTVSWRAEAVYDTPDIIYLAAWSPLLIAGAPVYSVDGRLAGEAWRRLGGRGASVWDLRRRVLRRGTVLATVVVGLALVVGSALGAAVRSTSTRADLPGQSELPINNQEGSPFPQATGGTEGGVAQTPPPSAGGSASPSPARQSPSAAASSSTPSAAESGQDGYGYGSAAGGGTTGGYGVPQQSSEPQRQSTRPGGTSGAGAGAGPGSSAPEPSASEGGGSSSDGGGALGGLLGSGPPSGWLLGAPRAGAAPPEGAA
jgi:uncharacterized membrane protein YphA (DoxX/SURF4 family)